MRGYYKENQHGMVGKVQASKFNTIVYKGVRWDSEKLMQPLETQFSHLQNGAIISTSEYFHESSI